MLNQSSLLYTWASFHANLRAFLFTFSYLEIFYFIWFQLLYLSFNFILFPPHAISGLTHTWQMRLWGVGWELKKNGKVFFCLFFFLIYLEISSASFWKLWQSFMYCLKTHKVFWLVLCRRETFNIALFPTWVMAHGLGFLFKILQLMEHPAMTLDAGITSLRIAELRGRFPSRWLSYQAPYHVHTKHSQSLKVKVDHRSTSETNALIFSPSDFHQSVRHQPVPLLLKDQKTHVKN